MPDAAVLPPGVLPRPVSGVQELGLRLAAVGAMQGPLNGQGALEWAGGP